MRYDAESLHNEFGVRFRLVESSKELHNTPFGTTQQVLILLLQSEINTFRDCIGLPIEFSPEVL